MSCLMSSAATVEPSAGRESCRRRRAIQRQGRSPRRRRLGRFRLPRSTNPTWRARQWPLSWSALRSLEHHRPRRHHGRARRLGSPRAPPRTRRRGPRHRATGAILSRPAKPSCRRATRALSSSFGETRLYTLAAPTLPRAVRSRQSISSSRAVSAVLISRSSCPRLAGTLHRSSFPGPGKTSNVQAAS